MDWNILFEYTAWACIIIGAFFTLTGAIGIIRMPDFYTRLHPVGITDSLGAPLILIGLAIKLGFTLLTAKIILLILFLLITGPTATHTLAKAALFNNEKPIGKIKEKKRT